MSHAAQLGLLQEGGQHLMAEDRGLGPQASHERRARGFWHRVVTVVGCIRKGAKSSLLAAAPSCSSAQKPGEESRPRAQPSQRERSRVPSGSARGLPPAPGLTVPARWALLVTTWKTTHTPTPARLSSPKGGLHSVRWCWVRAVSVVPRAAAGRESRAPRGWGLGVSSRKES